MNPIRVATWLWLLAAIPAGMASAAALAPSDQTAVIGVTREITVAVNLSLDSNDMVSTFQFEIHYDASQLMFLRMDTGSAGLESGKQVGYYVPAAGTVRAVLFGSNQVGMRSGVIALPYFRPAPNARAGSTSIQISNTVISSPQAAAVASTEGSGTITFLMPESVSGLDDAKAYPNPFCPASGHARIYFGPLPQAATIQIHMLNGGLVREIHHQGSGLELWDAKNAAGHNLASGVYLYFITAPSGAKKSGRIVIIR